MRPPESRIAAMQAALEEVQVGLASARRIFEALPDEGPSAVARVASGLFERSHVEEQLADNYKRSSPEAAARCRVRGEIFRAVAEVFRDYVGAAVAREAEHAGRQG